MSRDQGPIVVETGYVASHQGPAEDTESYTRELGRTPAPGERTFVERPRAAADEHTLDDTGWIQRTSSDGNARTSSFPSTTAMLVAGALLLGALSITTVGILLLLGTSQVADSTPVLAEPTPDEPVQAEDDATWQGLKVRKGLR